MRLLWLTLLRIKVSTLLRLAILRLKSISVKLVLKMTWMLKKPSSKYIEEWNSIVIERE
jgi:hypothetical protein